jgi:phosphonate transport system permease protein
VVLAVIFAAAARVIELRPLELLLDVGNMAVFLKGYLRPSYAYVGEYTWQCLVTICMALWGTLIAMVLAVPLGLLGARNLTPHPLLYQAARRLMDLLRFESDIRSASVIGMVGGGGIGFYLWETIRSFNDREAATVILLIVAMVMGIDVVSARLRQVVI